MPVNEQVEFGVWRDAWLRNNAAAPAPILNEYGDFLVVLGDPAAWPNRGGGPAGRSLSEDERAGQAALARRQDAGRQLRLSQNRLLGQRWDELDDPAMRFDPFREHPDEKVPDRGIEEAPPPWPTRLRGKTAVALLFVSGPTADLQITMDDEDEIRAQVQEAASYLARQAPNADVSFAHSFSRAHVDTTPPAVTGNHNSTEARWRDAALAKLGLPSGRDGLIALARRKKAETGADSAFVIILTRYPLTHYAYTDRDMGKVTVNLGSFDTQLTGFDAVVAHEACHIFGAPDEYGRCDCLKVSGPFGVANRNCVNCAPDLSEPCLMLGLTWKMCTATRYHLGYTGLPPAGPDLIS